MNEAGFDGDQNHFDWSADPVLRTTEPPTAIDARRPAGPPSFQDSNMMRFAPATKETDVEAGVGQDVTLESSLPPFTVKMP